MRRPTILAFVLALSSAAIAFAQPTPPAPPPSPPAAPSASASARASAAAPPKAAKGAKPLPPPALPAPEVRTWLIATGALSPWTFRVDNEGAEPVRIPADIRLLSFEVDVIDAKGKRKTTKCSVPASLRPDSFPDKRALLLAQGKSYIETFDPRLFCFGKDAAALDGGNVVHTRFGWPAPKGKKNPEGPFAIEGTVFPPTVAAVKEATLPTVGLAYFIDYEPDPPPAKVEEPKKDDAKKDSAKAPDAKKDDAKKDAAKAPDPKKDDAKKDDAKKDDAKKDDAKKDEPPIVDQNAARLEVSSAPYSDAADAGHAAITVTATNAGHRPMTIVVLERMVSFRVEGPDGNFRCDSQAPTRAVPRELFRTLKPDQKVSMTILLHEICPDTAFKRPGLYRVTAKLDARESGAEQGLTAYTATVRAVAPTLLRLAAGPLPFYATEPAAVDTPASEPPPEAPKP